MQVELTALQPQLIETSAETEKMMLHIEKETAEVDAKKELVAADEQEANEAAAVAQGIKVISSGYWCPIRAPFFPQFNKEIVVSLSVIY